MILTFCRLNVCPYDLIETHSHPAPADRFCLRRRGGGFMLQIHSLTITHKKDLRAIISISHDRSYIDEVCDKVYRMTADGLVPQSKEIFRMEQENLKKT